MLGELEVLWDSQLEERRCDPVDKDPRPESSTVPDKGTAVRAAQGLSELRANRHNTLGFEERLLLLTRRTWQHITLHPWRLLRHSRALFSRKAAWQHSSEARRGFWAEKCIHEDLGRVLSHKQSPSQSTRVKQTA